MNCFSECGRLVAGIGGGEQRLPVHQLLKNSSSSGMSDSSGKLSWALRLPVLNQTNSKYIAWYIKFRGPFHDSATLVTQEDCIFVFRFNCGPTLDDLYQSTFTKTIENQSRVDLKTISCRSKANLTLFYNCTQLYYFVCATSIFPTITTLCLFFLWRSIPAKIHGLYLKFTTVTTSILH